MEYADRKGLFEHDLRHGLRSASEQPLLRELRALHHAPDSGVELLIEQRFDMSPVFMGFIDLVILDRRSESLRVTLRDHKFTGDKRYIPDEETARSDYQTIIYAKALIEFFSLDSIGFSYDYYGTKYKWQSFLQFDLTRDFINDIWLKTVIRDTQRVLTNYSVPNGAQTTPSFFSCQKYGGCEFKELCFGETK